MIVASAVNLSFYPWQIKSNQIKSNQIKSNQIKSNQIFERFDLIYSPDRSTRPYHPMANGLVEAHNKILKTYVFSTCVFCKCLKHLISLIISIFSKLTKMYIESGDHWCKLLKSAVIAMNSTKK